MRSESFSGVKTWPKGTGSHDKPMQTKTKEQRNKRRKERKERKEEGKTQWRRRRRRETRWFIIIHWMNIDKLCGIMRRFLLTLFCRLLAPLCSPKFLMKPVNIHHILIFSLYIALKCQKLKIPKQPPLGVHAAPNFFLIFEHRTEKMWIQVIISYCTLGLV